MYKMAAVPLCVGLSDTQPQGDLERAQEGLKFSTCELPFSCKSSGPSSICTQLVSTELGCLTIAPTVKLGKRDIFFVSRKNYPNPTY